jgi:octaprenyl-diphosphate synthase
MLTLTGTDRTIRDRLKAEMADVESRFTAELISDLPCVNSLVTHIERYRGKMFRPMLVLVSGMATSPDGVDVTEAHRVVATVVEMVHMATLVHDDVLDEASVRRGGQTVNTLRGNETAVMLGDYMISHAYHLCSSLEEGGAYPGAGDGRDGGRRGPGVCVSRIIADATNTVCEGELLQLANRNNRDLDEGAYFEIIRRKTASLCGTCCRVAAMLHDAPDAAVESLYDYGEKVGIAFQIIDDLLDLVGSEQTVGKTLGRDLEKGKLTLPLIHCLATADAAARQELCRLLGDGGAGVAGEASGGGGGRAAHVRDAVAANGAMAYARQWAGRLVEQAKAALEPLPDTPARTLLADMADAVLARQA